MIRLFLSICLFASLRILPAQELFIRGEAASSLPKKVLGIRVAGETFQEVNIQKFMLAIRAMYGVNSKLTVYASAISSNHHGSQLPVNFIQHSHSGSGLRYYAGQVPKGAPYSYYFNGIHLYAKYRFLTLDRPREHFRMAVFGEWSHLRKVHDEAEPNLMEDTPGWGGGIITTYLKRRFAISLTSGLIFPNDYLGVENVRFTTNPPESIRLQYGNAQYMILSVGYLLSPAVYADYNQSNWNIYAECLYKNYGKAEVERAGEILDIQNNYLQAGQYAELYVGVQHIIRSNLRIDVSIGMNVLHRSYVHFYPLVGLGIQHLFFL